MTPPPAPPRSRRLDIALVDGKPSLEIDGALVARALDLEVATFQQHMDNGIITVLCERGVGEDAGRHRVTFYHQSRRARFVLDETGRIVG